MFSNNVCTFIGNVGKDKEVSEINGTNKASFSIGVSGTKKNDKVETLWINCEAWGKLADLEIKKGDLLSVVGALKENSYEKNGQTIKKWFLKVEGLKSFGNRSNNNSTGNQSNSYNKQGQSNKPTGNNSNYKKPVNDDFMDFGDDEIPPF